MALVVWQGRVPLRIPLTNSVKTKASGELIVFLHHRTDAIKSLLAVLVQSLWRMHAQHRAYYQARFGIVLIQALWRGYSCRNALHVFYDYAQTMQAAAR